MPLPIMFMLSQFANHLLPIPLESAKQLLQSSGIGQCDVKDLKVVISTENN